GADRAKKSRRARRPVEIKVDEGKSLQRAFSAERERERGVSAETERIRPKRSERPSSGFFQRAGSRRRSAPAAAPAAVAAAAAAPRPAAPRRRGRSSAGPLCP